MPQSIFSVEKIRAASGGFAKGNRYNVTIIPPQLLSSNTDAIGKFQYLCESV